MTIKLPDIFGGSIDKDGLCADAILEPTKKEAKLDPLFVDFPIPEILERVARAKQNAERRQLED